MWQNFKSMIFKFLSQNTCLGICCQGNATEPHLWEVNIGSGNSFGCQATNHYLSWCRSRSLSPNDIIRPQRVKQSGALTNSDSVLPECISQPSYFLFSIVVFTRNAHETIDAYIHQWTRSPQVYRLAYHIIPSIPWAVLPLFATRFVTCTVGIVVSFIEACLF